MLARIVATWSIGGGVEGGERAVADDAVGLEAGRFLEGLDRVDDRLVEGFGRFGCRRHLQALAQDRRPAGRSCAELEVGPAGTTGGGSSASAARSSASLSRSATNSGWVGLYGGQRRRRVVARRRRREHRDRVGQMRLVADIGADLGGVERPA